MEVLGGRVLVRHALKPPTSSGGIHIPEKFRGQAQEGVVVHVSKGWWAQDVGWIPNEDVHVGDRVLFEKHKGQVVQVGEAALRCIHLQDVLAKLRTGKVRVCRHCKGQGVV
jgi:co-chaperonin GroES (HSP10)